MPLRSFALLPLCVLALGACGPGSPETHAGTPEDPWVIGMSQCNLGEPWRVQMNEDVRTVAAGHSNLRIIFKDAQNNSLTQRAQVEEFVEQGVDLIIISPKEAAPLTRPVAAAYQRGIPVIVLDQLNRAAEASGTPKISNLRESGAIEQDADVVALLHRDRETDSEEAKKSVAEGNGIETKLIIAKNRNGPTGVVDLTFYPSFTLFDTPDRIADEDVPV